VISGAFSIAMQAVHLGYLPRLRIEHTSATERGQIYLVQTRPVTTFARTKEEGPPDGGPTLLVRGLGASPGRASGRVRVLASGQEGKLKVGEVLVAAMTSPDWVPLMRKAAAIVTDSGGMTSHAAIVSRELGVPCVVGTRTATQLLRDGTEVTVDGSAGAEAHAARQLGAQVAERTGLPVDYQDERWTTREAERTLRELGAKGRKLRAHSDRVAAALVLRTWLDRRGR